MNTIYRPVPEHTDLYAGMDGSIVKAGYGALEQKIHKRSKYVYVTIPPRPRTNGAQRSGYRNVHILVAQAFLGPRPEGMQIRHSDGDRSNPALENLCYGTAKDNQRDSIAHGTHASLVRAARPACLQGHEYTPENTYRTPSGARKCRQCDAVAHQKARARRAELKRARLAAGAK